MTCPDVSNNSRYLEGKPRKSAILKQLLDDINGLVQSELIQSTCDYQDQISIFTATGIWLDYIGDRLSFKRPKIAPDEYNWFGFDGNGYGFDQANFIPGGSGKVGITDDSYRAILFLRGAQLITDGSIPSLNAILEGAFTSGNYVDYGDMTMDVIIDNTLTDIIIVALVEAGLITKPAGVRIKNIFIKHISGTFGFDGNGVGFDQGLFVRTYDDLIV